jgi:hypothetical protein
MGVATFMILDQLQIAPAIVQITYIAVLGSVALGMAIAFGLGGRDVAGRLLEEAYRNGRERRAEVREHRARFTADARRDAALRSQAPTTGP